MFDFINTKRLRKRYYASEHELMHITLSSDTKWLLGEMVPIGKGLYGSAFVEMSLRLMIALLSSGEELDGILEDIDAIQQSPYLENNIRRMAKYFGVI
jgi:hypothetical protein